MKRIYSLVLIILIAAIGVYLFIYWDEIFVEPTVPPGFIDSTGHIINIVEEVRVIAEGLEIPWDIAFLPDGGMLVTERGGKLIYFSKDTKKTEIKIPDVKLGGEGGLLGMTLHPNFASNNYLYLYMSSPAREGTENRVQRYTLKDGALTEEIGIIDNIPGALYHDGGRMEFGPDGYLYITTGDATRENLAQDKNSLAGKILRIKDNGEILEDNPFGTAVYSYGHRNPQGLAWDDDGDLWETEHGRSGVLSGLDELNLIEKGKNYGWPTIEGDETRGGMTAPVVHSGPDVTWAPASLLYYDGSLFWGGLRGEALYEAVLDRTRVVEVKEHFKGEFGRIRTVRLGPDGMFYLTTSNTDGRGTPQEGDDKIIRINPGILD